MAVVNFKSMTMAIPPYRVAVSEPTVTAAGVSLSLTVFYDFDPTAPGTATLENVMVWLDGKLLCQGYDFNHPQPRNWHRGVYTAGYRSMRFDLDLAGAYFPWAEPGPHELVISLWTSVAPAKDIAWLVLPLALPDRPAPPVKAGVVLRSMFGANVDEARRPGVAEALRAAGVNTLTNGCFRNPADSGGAVKAVDQWRAWSLAWLKDQLAWAKAAGFFVQVTGDDLLRTVAERSWLVTTTWAERAVEETVQTLVDSDICVGIEGLDEVSELVAGRPPAAFSAVAVWVRSIPGHPPLAWPVAARFAGSLDPMDDPVRNAYETPALSDYCSRYWTDAEFRTGRPPPDGVAAGQILAGFRRATANLGGRPFLCQVAATGPFYTKRVPGGDYQHGRDDLQKGSVRAGDVVAQVWLALAFGAAGVRLYSYDHTGWVAERLNSPVGFIDRQTGSRPGDSRWSGVVAALTSIARREADLTTGHCYPAVVTDTFVYGRRGPLRWAVNVTDAPAEINAPGTLLTPAGEVDFAGGLLPPAGVLIDE